MFLLRLALGARRFEGSWSTAALSLENMARWRANFPDHTPSEPTPSKMLTKLSDWLSASSHGRNVLYVTSLSLTHSLGPKWILPRIRVKRSANCAFERRSASNPAWSRFHYALPPWLLST